ncbi:MAG: hypothetical protein KDA86_15310 [Planctomycetaceae bacterium]|nr:hypothetical protein [Planctomycetaceae bacterium]
MLPTSHADIELLESEELPVRTLVAPLILARELRLVLAELDLNIEIGTRDAVIISSDLYQAFQQWNEAVAEDDSSESSWN